MSSSRTVPARLSLSVILLLSARLAGSQMTVPPLLLDIGKAGSQLIDGGKAVSQLLEGGKAVGQLIDIGKNLEPILKNIPGLGPSTTAAPITTTTPPSPIEDLAKTLKDIPGSVLPTGQLLVQPIETLNSVLKKSINVTRESRRTFEMAADSLIRVNQSTRKLMDKLTPLAENQEMLHYDSYDPELGLVPRYFSKSCKFRFACELGKASILPAASLGSPAWLNHPFTQDLHNRYTRAFSYGATHADCSKYYCLYLEFFMGPGPFVGGVLEFMNRVVNNKLYQ